MAEPEAAQEAKVGADTLQTGGAPREAPGDAQGSGGGAVSILFVGDLVGSIGRHTLLECLPMLRERYAPTFVVVNAENVAGGLGITPKVAEELFRNEIDAITLGNHAYHRREIYSYLDTKERIVRPFNYLRGQPGRGVCVVEKGGIRLGVVNLSGNLFLKAGRSAFTEIDPALRELGKVDHVLVDMHAEATSEKVALGWLLDGTGDGGGGNPHPRAHRRRQGAARRNRLHHRRGHDRPARRRDRGQARAGRGGARHADAGALRDLQGGPLADGRARARL